MSLKAFDVVAGTVWAAMVLCLLAGAVATVVRPEPRTFYGSDTGLCDYGCSDSR